MALANSTNTYSNSRYIVDNVSPGSPFTTVQAAINAANAAGGNASIWVRQGTYTENLTLYSGINIEGQEQSISIIVGQHTPPASGSCHFTRIGLQATTTNSIFSSAVAGTATLSCLRCQFNINNGYVYNLPNWTGELRAHWCADYSTHNGLVYNTAGATITFNHSLFGKGTTATFTANGNVSMFSVMCDCPLLFNGTGTSILEGGSVFGGNISTANTHLLRIAQCRLSTGATQAITHNSATTLVLDSTIVGTSNATAIGGTGTIKMVMVPFPNSSALAGTITQSLDGITRTAEVWAENITRMKFTGFYSWAAAGPYFNDATLGTFKLLVGGTGYIKDQRVTWVAQDITGLTAGSVWYIYIDSAGTIGKTATRTDALFEDYIVLFECLRDSTPVTNIQYTVRENHPYSYPTSSSNWAHDTAGIIIENNTNGANIVLNGTRKLQINGADVLNDHGIETTIPDSGGAAVTWTRMYTTAAGKWATQNATDTFSGYWNSAGTPTLLTANRYGVYRLYVTKDSLNTSTPRYFAVLNTAQYTTQANANTAIANGTAASATAELAGLELAQLGFITYRQSTNAITNVVISKSTLRSTLSTGGGTGTAALVTTDVTDFDGVLSSADTNVQAALETIDEYRGGLFAVTATVDATASSNRRHTIKHATPASLLTLTLPAAPIFGDTISVNGYTAGGWKIAQNANQQIFMGTSSTTIGAGGSLSSSSAKDCVTITCVTAGASAEWTVISSQGNLTIV